MYNVLAIRLPGIKVNMLHICCSVKVLNIIADQHYQVFRTPGLLGFFKGPPSPLPKGEVGYSLYTAITVLLYYLKAT